MSEPLDHSEFYRKAIAESELIQGEIISEIIQFKPQVNSETNEVTLDTYVHPFLIVATQDCDLLQDYNRVQNNQSSTLNEVLCFEARVIDGVARDEAGGSDIWKRIVQNKDERFHCLEAAAADSDLIAKGLPDLVVDFKRFFGISPAELYRQTSVGGNASRRSALISPAKENFQNRAATYMARVAIARPHNIAKVAKIKN